MPRKPFHADGLRFTCTECGKCCLNHDDYSFVYLSRAEAEALARYFALSSEAFEERYCARDEGDLVLADDGRRCILLGDDDRCAAYEARPVQCRTWPFWPENLTRRKWKEIEAFCPGAGKGRLHSREEIEAAVQATEDAEEEGEKESGQRAQG